MRSWDAAIWSLDGATQSRGMELGYRATDRMKAEIHWWPGINVESAQSLRKHVDR